MGLKRILDQFADCAHKPDADHQLGSRVAALLASLLRAVYAHVRGQAAAGVVRSLLALEIEIGGENGDFREFDAGQMIDLFNRGDVVRRLPKRVAPGLNLCAAMDLQALADWIAATAGKGFTRSPAALQFIHAWLRLLAEESGSIDPLDDRMVSDPVVSQPGQTVVSEAWEAGKAFTDQTTGMTFVFVPGGSFAMGDTFDAGVEDEKPVHEVHLSDFYMATCPVTQAQWRSLMMENPSKFVRGDHPVEQVALADVMRFVDRLNAGSPSGLRFDLPSEAQWEYAARSGGKDELYAGGQDPDAVAWYEDNTFGSSAPVGGKQPNGLGLHDMSGNVWEWCRDLYHPEAYRHHAKNDPLCTRGDSDRVIRGGSWNLDAWSVRCSRRFRFNPELFGPALGFRLVMRVDGSSRH
jgi:formylglycine-generating enzyme required for sulfatase activity